MVCSRCVVLVLYTVVGMDVAWIKQRVAMHAMQYCTATPQWLCSRGDGPYLDVLTARRKPFAFVGGHALAHSLKACGQPHCGVPMALVHSTAGFTWRTALWCTEVKHAMESSYIIWIVADPSHCGRTCFACWRRSRQLCPHGLWRTPLTLQQASHGAQLYGSRR